MAERLNKGFEISLGELESRIGHFVDVPKDYGIFIPAKKIVNIEGIQIMKKEELYSFLRNIPLVEDKSVRPYFNAEFNMFSLDPSVALMHQKFILESKLLSLLKVDALYFSFAFNRLSTRPPHYIWGLNEDSEKRSAVYLPPLVEHNSHPFLIDGNTRSTLCESVGSTIMALGIRGSSVDLPYSGVPWDPQIVKEKPPVKERYHDFNPDLLKDFEYVGIDG